MHMKVGWVAAAQRGRVTTTSNGSYVNWGNTPTRMVILVLVSLCVDLDPPQYLVGRWYRELQRNGESGKTCD